MDVSRSGWYSLEITRSDWPWIFAKGDKPALDISTLEAFAVLALKVFHIAPHDQQHVSVTVVPTWTDNRGNGSALNPLMSTRYPSSAVILELAAFMKKASIKAQVEWSPRAGNSEADALANGDFHGFDPALRCNFDPANMDWVLLPEALEIGHVAEQEVADAKARRALPNRSAKTEEAQT